MFDWRGNESQRLQTNQNEAAKQAPSDRSCHGRRSLNDVLTCRLKAARGVFDLEMSEVWKRPKNESLASFTPRTVGNYARPRRLTMQWRKYFTGLAFSFVFVVTCFTNKVGVGAEKCLTSCWWKLRELATLPQVNEAGEVALVAERNVVTSITVHVWVWHHLLTSMEGFPVFILKEMFWSWWLIYTMICFHKTMTLTRCLLSSFFPLPPLLSSSSQC